MMTAVALVPFCGVSLTAPLPVEDTPVSVPTTAEVQVNVVPGTDEVGVKFSPLLLQISCKSDGGEFVITGVGDTVTTTSIVLPWHVPAEGVIRYVTVPDVVPLVEVNV
jgi:hypothetical protein